MLSGALRKHSIGRERKLRESSVSDEYIFGLEEG